MTKRPSWDEYFINIAQAISKRATCLRRTYGAVITNNNIIISTGYNGSPCGLGNCCDIGYCKRDALAVPKGQRYELCEAVHAEQNAVINGDPVKMAGGTIYVAGQNADGTLASGEPCLICRRMIANARISRVVYLDKDGQLVTITAQDLLKQA